MTCVAVGRRVEPHVGNADAGNYSLESVIMSFRHNGRAMNARFAHPPTLFLIREIPRRACLTIGECGINVTDRLNVRERKETTAARFLFDVRSPATLFFLFLVLRFFLLRRRLIHRSSLLSSIELEE